MEASVARSTNHMKRSLVTAPTKSSIFALYRSLLRQTRLLPHEYLRYFLAISHPSTLMYDLCIFVGSFSASNTLPTSILHWMTAASVGNDGQLSIVSERW